VKCTAYRKNAWKYLKLKENGEGLSLGELMMMMMMMMMMTTILFNFSFIKALV
jgi:hypothetical protein